MPGRDGAAGMRVNNTLYSFVLSQCLNVLSPCLSYSIFSKKAGFTSQSYFTPLTALQRPCAPFVKSPGN